jgi:hypothetical protein
MALRIIIYLFIACYLFYTTILFVRKRLKPLSLVDAFIAVSIIVISQQVLTGWLLGLMKRQFALEMFLANFAISTALLLVASPRRRDYLEPFRFIADVMRSWWRLCRRMDILLFSILDIILLALLLARGIIYPIYSYDGVVYHLSEVGFMLQDGALGIIPTPVIETYPRNIELTYFWNAVFVPHQVHLNCLQIPYIILAVFACYGILRKAGCRRHPSAIAALTFPTFPVIMQQATTAYIDIAISTCILCGVNFLAQRKMRLQDVVLAGLALGVVAGGKGTGVLLAGSVTLAWLFLKGWVVLREIRLARFLAWLLILLVALMLNGAWIYARNWAVFGNPVHPYLVKFGDNVVFKGTVKFESHVSPELLGDNYDKLMRLSWPGRMYYSWSEPKPFITYDSRIGGFGPIFFILYLPAAIASVIISLLQRRWRMLFVLALLTAPLISVHSLSFWCRYVIFFTAAGMAGFAYIVGIMRRYQWKQLLSFFALALALLSSFLYFRVPPVDKLQALKYFLDRGPSYWHPSQFAPGAWQNREFFRRVYMYERPGTTIMIDSTFRGFQIMCLWNLDFTNRVVFIRADDRDEWFRGLEESAPDYLIVGTGLQSHGWVKQRPARFELLVGSERLMFYRFKPAVNG